MDVFVLKDSVTGNMTDAEFLRFCLENPDLRIERNSNLEIIIMSPVTTLSSFHSTEIIRQLSNWSVHDGRGLAFDSSTGFTLPDRSVLSPDASWLMIEKWNALSNEEKDRFAPVCPDFVIEVRSKSDHIDDLLQKMKVWIKNGAAEVWLIDPREATSYTLDASGALERYEGFARKLAGKGMIKGFELDLSRLKI
jgi:Uma2 family endonuclease